MDFQKKQPTLFVGLGGAGGAIVNRIAGILKRRPDWDTMKNVMQFFALDTDKADLDSCNWIPQANRFAISGFDKGLWVQDKLGRGGASKPDPDPRVSQWVHDWYNFRASQGAGAGQIRIESRVSLFNCLESTDLVKRIEEVILATVAKENTLVDFQIKKFNVFLYYTVAGGTGSGAHLMFASFLRYMIGNFGWSANIIGISILSTLVLPHIRNMRQREDILANGYSAMKEVEHLMRLKVFSDQRDPTNRREFIYHPFISTTTVDQSPFDFVYVLDTNPDVNIGKGWRTATADAIYLQLFSPIFAKRNSDFDNYEKNQKRLARDLYSTFYGSYGCSVLLLPDKDLLKYCCSRRTADVIEEYLSTNLTLKLKSGVKDFAPTTEDLEDLDHQAQERLWDQRFVDFLRARVTEAEDTKVAGAVDRKALKKHGRALHDRGFALTLRLDKLAEEVSKITTQPLDEQDRSRLYKMILPRPIAADEAEDLEDENEPSEESVAVTFKTNIESYLLSYGTVSSVAEGVIRIEKENDEHKISDGDFRAFWDLLDGDYLTPISDAVRFSHHRTWRGVSTKEGNLEDSADQFSANIQSNVQQLREAEERSRAVISNLRDSLGRKYISDFLARKSTPFELQRLFVLAHAELSATICAVLKKVLGNQLDSTKEILSQATRMIRESLAPAAEVKFSERVIEIFGKKGAADFSQAVERMDRWVEILCQRYSALIFLQFYHDLHDHLSEVFRDVADNLRRFSKQAQSEIQEIIKDAEEFKDNPGGAAQAEEFHNDIEALQGFDGHRMWKDYYDVFIKHKVGIKAKTIHDTIAAIFSDRQLVTPRDQIDKIRAEFYRIVEHELRPKIVGEYSLGKEKRGLTLQKALEAEAQLKFRIRLQATGEWADRRETWETVIQKAGAGELHSRSEKDLYDEMWRFSRNYLESKIASCIRRSAIMANIDMEDVQVTEYSCKQSLLCYDHDLYGDPESDVDTLSFPSLVRRLDTEFMDHDYTDNGEMAIFYQAILGVPLFVFRNLITSMREAYNKRVRERNWAQPMRGRQYPLHVDRNWEPGDPGVDESKLPLSIDPEEAVVSSREINSDRCRFFAYWYALYRTGHIVRDEERGFLVPSGRLGNTGPDIELGRNVREAIQTMLRAQSAHGTLEEAFKKVGEPKLEALEKHRDYCLDLLGGDVWGRDESDPEIKELADLFHEQLEFRKLEIQKEELVATRRSVIEGSVGVVEGKPLDE